MSVPPWDLPLPAPPAPPAPTAPPDVGSTMGSPPPGSFCCRFHHGISLYQLLRLHQLLRLLLMSVPPWDLSLPALPAVGSAARKRFREAVIIITKKEAIPIRLVSDRL
ncbi:unnamed protein product [Leuciscus chuanchicus]